MPELGSLAEQAYRHPGNGPDKASSPIRIRLHAWVYSMLRHYVSEMFEPTLLYGFALAVLGVSAAVYYGHFAPLYAALVIIGSVLAQISANIISDYFDYTSGLDKQLAKKKSGRLSGGSSLLASKMIAPGPTLLAGLVTFAAAAAIGIYLLLSRPQILPILIVAALSILLYARYAKRVPYLSEPLCSLNYILIAFGSFIVIAGISSLTYALAFSLIPAGIMLGGNALFVNEVPDRLTDRKFGVRHSAVMLKTGRRIGLYYISWQAVAYILLAIGILIGAVPNLAIACFITLPVTFYVFNGLYNLDSRRYGRYLGMHTLYSFALAIVLAVAYLSAL